MKAKAANGMYENVSRSMGNVRLEARENSLEYEQPGGRHIYDDFLSDDQHEVTRRGSRKRPHDHDAEVGRE